ncbi:C-C motif chemokine 18-like [Colossoma macropomum]|uniref:C-C motif chemokine 18-like n=1 Tax=Colossoma macropomum TaxID=42526 RepID=UPI00186565CA|nr:C-C motif chemokine 18-like [Colossoma macropomum]
MLHWNSNLCALAVLLVLFGCTTGVSGSYRLPTRVQLVCCEEVSKMPIPRNIELIGYKHQSALAPCVEAIIFYSKTEKFCSDPTARWIRKRQKDLEEYKN